MSSGLDLTLLSTYFVLKGKILSIEIKTILRYTILIYKVDEYVLGSWDLRLLGSPFLRDYSSGSPKLLKIYRLIMVQK